MVGHRIERLQFYGNCLGGIGFPVNGGIAVIDLDEKPRVLDVVFCSGPLDGGVNGFLKQVLQAGPKKPIVATCYARGTGTNYIFAPESIYGVVLRAEDEAGNVIWERSQAVPFWRQEIYAEWAEEKYKVADKRSRSGWRIQTDRRCSNCKARFRNQKTPFCPICGAVMRPGKKNVGAESNESLSTAAEGGEEA